MLNYRELVLLFDPAYSSDSDKRRIAEVVSHELVCVKLVLDSHSLEKEAKIRSKIKLNN